MGKVEVEKQVLEQLHTKVEQLEEKAEENRGKVEKRVTANYAGKLNKSIEELKEEITGVKEQLNKLDRKVSTLWKSYKDVTDQYTDSKDVTDQYTQ